MTSTESLLNHRISDRDVFYIPNFIKPEEESYLIRKINESAQQKWKKLANRRLQIWGGELTKRGILLAQPMPSFIDTYPDIIKRLRDTGAFKSSPHGAPNHVILNEYYPGQGIMPHEDGPKYHPVVATLSLGSHTVFNYYQYKTEGIPDSLSSASDGEGRVIDTIPILSVLLERRSLVISSGTMYTSHLHGIEEVEADRIELGDDTGTPNSVGLGVKIANWKFIDDVLKESIIGGEELKRCVRYSLTCRDVGRVATTNSILRH